MKHAERREEGRRVLAMRANREIRRALDDPYNYVAIGRDPVGHLAIEAAAVRQNDDFSPRLVSEMLRSAARRVDVSLRFASMMRRRADLLSRKKRARA